MADQKTSTDNQKEPAKKAPQEDEVVGKAYDGRLMRRLLTYLRPYKLQVGLSAISILFKAATDVMGPFLVKVAVDTYMTGTPPGKLSWLARHISAEPMTGITNAANLSQAGKYPNLQTLAPGARWSESFWVKATGI